MNALRKDVNTALIVASEKGDVEIAQMLLSNETMVELENKDGKTALQGACENSSWQGMHELLHPHIRCLNHHSDVPDWVLDDQARCGEGE